MRAPEGAPGGETGPGRPDRRRDRALIAAVVAALLGGGVWFLVGESASFDKLGDAIRGADVPWLAGSAVSAAVGYVGYTPLYRAFVRVAGGPRPPLRLVLRMTVAMFGASVIGTSAGRLGSQYWALRQLHERPATAWSRTLAINTAEWGILGLLAWAGALLLVVDGSSGTPLWLELVWLLALPACVIPALHLSSPSRPAFAADRGGKVRRALAAGVRGVVLLRQAVADRGSLAEALAGGALYWAGQLLTLWAALRAFGIHLGYGGIVVGYATGYASTMLPLPAGGAGGIDAANIYALTLVGVPFGPAVLATLVQRLWTYWVPLAVAILAARSIRRLPGDLAATAGPPSYPPPDGAGSGGAAPGGASRWSRAPGRSPPPSYTS